MYLKSTTTTSERESNTADRVQHYINMDWYRGNSAIYCPAFHIILPEDENYSGNPHISGGPLATGNVMASSALAFPLV